MQNPLKVHTTGTPVRWFKLRFLERIVTPVFVKDCWAQRRNRVSDFINCSMKLKLTISMLLLSAVCVWGQPSLFTTGVQHFNPEGLYHHFIQTADGGFAQTPTIFDTVQQMSFVLLVRYDTAGRVMWTKRFPMVDYQSTFLEDACVIQTSDAGFVIATTLSRWTPFISAGRPVACLIKTDSSGNVLWSRVYKGYGTSYAYGVCETADHGIAVCGVTADTVVASATQAFLFRTDSIGNQLWSYGYDGLNGNTHTFRTVRESALQHQLIVLGTTVKFGMYARMDSIGTVLNTLYTTTVSVFIDEAETNAGNVVIMGAHIMQNHTELYEITPAGTVVWSWRYSNVPGFEGTSMLATSTGYTIAGMPSYTGTGGMRLAHVDFAGLPLWEKEYPEMNGLMGPCLVYTADNGYCIAGEYFGITSAQDGSIIVKTDTIGTSACASNSLMQMTGFPNSPISQSFVRNTAAGSSAEQMHMEAALIQDTVYCQPVLGTGDLSLGSALSIFPNPAGDQLSIHYVPPDDDDLRIRLCDAQGRTVFEDELRSDQQIIDLSDVAPGMYFLLVEKNGFVVAQKPVIHN